MAALALLVGLYESERETLRAFRSPIVLALLALAGLSVVSALWTIGTASASIRWGFVVLGYGVVVAVAAGFAARSNGPHAIALTVAVLAAAAGVLGLFGAVVGIEPFGERIGGTWRPGGPFEYPPALALVQIAALPAVLGSMVGRHRHMAALAALFGAIAGSVIALSQSRASVVFALAVLVASVLLPDRYAGRRSVRALAVIFVAGSAAASYALAGGLADGVGGGAEHPLTVLAVLVCAAGLWIPVRSVVENRLSEFKIPAGRPLAVLALVGAIGVLAVTVFSPPSGAGIEPSGGFAHGRTRDWSAAANAVLDRPVLGAGADAYYATAYRDDVSASFYAHNLPLETGVELGFIGGALLLTLYVSVGVLLWRARRSRVVWLLGVGVAAFMFSNLFDWTWHLAGVGAIWAAMLGGLLGSRGASPDRGETASHEGDPLHATAT